MNRYTEDRIADALIEKLKKPELWETSFSGYGIQTKEKKQQEKWYVSTFDGDMELTFPGGVISWSWSNRRRIYRIVKRLREYLADQTACEFRNRVFEHIA